MPFGQFQRLCRICDNEEDFNIKSKEMFDRFKERGSTPKVLNAALNKAQAQERSALLQRKPKNNDNDREFFSTR